MEEVLSSLKSESLKKVNEDIENEEEIVSLLKNLGNLVEISHSTEVIRRILSVDILKVLDSFELPRVREYATEVIEKVFSFINVEKTPEYNNYILVLINSGHFEKVALHKLLKDLDEKKFIPSNEIKSKLINLLLSSNTAIASPTESLMIKIYGVEDLTGTQNLTSELFAKLQKCNAEQACRILEVSVQVALKSNNHLRHMEDIIKFCFSNSDFKDDILFEMNLLEILQNLFDVDYGFEFLDRNDVLKKYAEQILDPEKALLASGIMKFFTRAALSNPRKILNEYSTLVELLLTTIRDDENFQASIFETLGQIFHTNESKRILHEKYDVLCCETLKKIFKSIPNYPSDFKSRIFECFEKIFTTDDDTNVNNQITYICERWFKESCISFDALLSYCKQPFQDISLASFRLINSLITHAFGRIALLKTGGGIEFLLDRSSISSYDVAVIKFEIIKKLSTSSEFDAATINLFCNYIRNGIYSNDGNATAIFYE